MAVSLPIPPRDLRAMPLHYDEMLAMLEAYEAGAADPVTQQFAMALAIHLGNRPVQMSDVAKTVGSAEKLNLDQYGRPSLHLRG